MIFHRNHCPFILESIAFERMLPASFVCLHSACCTCSCGDERRKKNIFLPRNVMLELFAANDITDCDSKDVPYPDDDTACTGIVRFSTVGHCLSPQLYARILRCASWRHVRIVQHADSNGRNARNSMCCTRESYAYSTSTGLVSVVAVAIDTCVLLLRAPNACSHTLTHSHTLSSSPAWPSGHALCVFM